MSVIDYARVSTLLRHAERHVDSTRVCSVTPYHSGTASTASPPHFYVLIGKAVLQTIRVQNARFCQQTETHTCPLTPTEESLDQGCYFKGG